MSNDYVIEQTSPAVIAAILRNLERADRGNNVTFGRCVVSYGGMHWPHRELRFDPRLSLPADVFFVGGFSGVAVRNPLDQILDRISEVCNPQQPSEDTPAAGVYEAVRRILIAANKITPITLEATAVEASEGDLLLHWDTSTKSVVLIVPKNGGAASVYRETLDGVTPVTSRLEGNASDAILSEAIAWVSSPIR